MAGYGTVPAAENILARPWTSRNATLSSLPGGSIRSSRAVPRRFPGWIQPAGQRKLRRMATFSDRDDTHGIRDYFRETRTWILCPREVQRRAPTCPTMDFNRPSARTRPPAADAGIYLVGSAICCTKTILRM